jgi:hypothetical protein
MLEMLTAWVEPVQIIGALETIKLFCFIVAMFGALLLLPMFSMQNNSLGMAFLGVILIFGSIGVGAFSNAESNNLQDLRPFVTYPSYSFNTSDYQPIVSLSDGSTYGMSGGGSFFLGIGSVSVNGKTTPQYVFYKKLSDGYQLGTIPAEDIVIKEDAAQDNATIEWLYQYTISDRKVFKDNNESVGGGESKALLKKYIHVPAGTVIKQYKLDSELK